VIAVNTTMAAATASMTALFIIYAKTKRFDLGMALNGALAGLVAITAPCAWVASWAAVIIGIISGIVMVVGVFSLEALKVDNPVGAVSVHGFNGLWGLLAVVVLVLCLTGLMAVSSVSAEEKEKPSADFAVDILSQYVWRGYALSRDSAVFQPSMTVSYMGFSVNVWGNYDTDHNNPFSPPQGGAEWNETDFTLSYGRELYSGEIIKSFSVDLGTIYYALDGVYDSWELYGGFGVDVNYLTASVTAYREASHYPGWWLQVGIGRSFAMPFANATLDLGNDYVFQFSEDAAAYPDPDDPTKSFDGPLAGHIYASMSFPVYKYVTITPRIGFWYALGGDSTDLIDGLSWDEDHNHIYRGVNVSFAF